MLHILFYTQDAQTIWFVGSVSIKAIFIRALSLTSIIVSIVSTTKNLIVINLPSTKKTE